MPLQLQTLLYNRYRIVAELGHGGMGAVYHARDENLGVDVAIKENLFVSPQYAQQFRREATLLASLRHPNLPRVTDHFVIPGQGQYLVMDYVAGEDAGQRLKRQGGPLPERAVAGWVADILDALQYLHNRQPPVVHRDIKPGNIKITPEGRAVLVDFGLAKSQDAAQATATGAKGLTPGFSPPEQYGSGRTDARSDLYSLGATMYTLLASHMPADALDRALGRATLIPLKQLNPQVSDRLVAATERALAIRPEERFASAAEFLAAVPRDDRTAPHTPEPTVVAERPLPAPARAAAQRAASPAGTARPSRRRWLMVAVPLLLLVAAGLATGGGLLALRLFAPGRTPVPTGPLTTDTSLLASMTPGAAASATQVPSATQAASATQRPAATASSTDSPTAQPSTTPPPKDTATPAPTTPAAPRATPVGGGAGQLAFVSERSGPPQVFLMDADGQNVTQLTHETQGACQPAWSPDGRQLLYVSPCAGKRDSYPASAIYIANADGSGSRPFITLLGGAYEPAWSVAGVAFTHLESNRPQIYVAGPDGSGAKDISTVHASDSQPSWSPDGKRLAFANLTRTGRPAIYWMFADGSFRPGFGNPDAVTRDTDASSPAWSPTGQYVAYIGGNAQIMIVAWDKFGFGVTTLTPEGPNANPAWSPDGQWLAFESWRNGANHDIYRMTLAGGQVSRLTNDPALEYQPAWRP